MGYYNFNFFYKLFKNKGFRRFVLVCLLAIFLLNLYATFSQADSSIVCTTGRVITLSDEQVMKYPYIIVFRHSSGSYYYYYIFLSKFLLYRYHDDNGNYFLATYNESEFCYTTRSIQRMYDKEDFSIADRSLDSFNYTPTIGGSQYGLDEQYIYCNFDLYDSTDGKIIHKSDDPNSNTGSGDDNPYIPNEKLDEMNKKLDNIDKKLDQQQDFMEQRFFRCPKYYGTTDFQMFRALLRKAQTVSCPRILTKVL